ncbi:MAG: M23 family metallopeptidase, partial [Chloroflexi bacterium]|nr:M23 family metallopeptidase [Chloroflexota bacterium]
SQTLLEPEHVDLALRQIADARELLRQASDTLSAPATSVVVQEGKPGVPREGRQLDIGGPPQDLLDIAQAVIHQVFPEQLAQRALQHGTSPRDWLYRVYTVSIVPRGISEPVATMVVMLAAVKFGLHHQLLLQTETRLRLAHKRPIPNLDLFLETFIAEMVAADPSDKRLNDWLRQMVIGHYPAFRNNKRLDLPSGDYLVVPDLIESIRRQAPAQADMSSLAISSPMDPNSPTIIPARSNWQITLGYARKLDNAKYLAYHGRYHSGIDIARYGCFQAPVYAMRPGIVIDSVYLPKGFGNTVLVEHEDGTCLRYTHLDKNLVKKDDRVARGQQIGTVGKGAKNIYAPHLHLDMPRSRTYARARTYYDTAAEVAERFINPLSRIPASI